YDYGYGLEELCDISAKLFDTVTTLIVNETENVEDWNSPIEIEIIPNCRSRVHIDVTDSVQLIYTPFYPNTPTNLFKCTWDLSSSQPFIRIKLVNSTKFPQCANSPLTVSDATSQFNENLCAQTTSVTASQPLYLTYHYTSKEDNVWVGTIALYPSQTSLDPIIKPKAVPTKGTTDNDKEEGVCTQTYESTSAVSNNCGSLSKQNTITMGPWEGTFSSPDFESISTYASIIDCTWIIEIPFSSHILLVFETFALQDPIIEEDNDYTCEDYVLITEYLDSESSSEIFYKCGTVNRRVYAIISYGNKMEVKFKSDASVNALGFKASYRGLCLRISQDFIGGSVTIPTDKLPQTNSIICRWKFALHQEYLFMVKMIEKNVTFPMNPFCGSSPFKITLYLENVNPVTEDLCKNKVFGSYYFDEFLILVYKWDTRNPDLSTWQGTVVLKYFRGYESFNCSWMCPQSECQFIFSLINLSPVLYCLCPELPLGLTCQEDSGQCKAEECDPSLCRKTVRNNTVFETPNFPELPSEDKLCVWKLFRIDSYVMVTFVNKSLEAMPNCGYYVIMMSLEDESKFELCKTTPIFLYKGLARLYYKFKKKGDFPNWIGQLDIQYTTSPADADCNRFCSESNCKLSFDDNASPNKAVTCICAESHLAHSCTINGTVCKAEECVFESCWQEIQKSSVFLTPNYPMAPSNYIKCVWTIYRPEEIVMIRFMNDSSDGAFLPTCTSSPIKLSFGTSSQILCKQEPVLVFAGKVKLVYDSRSSLIPWVGGVAVDFTYNPNDVNCAWLCSQSSCQLKYMESPHWFTCICKERYLNLDCSDHNDLCMSEPCLLREPETIKNYNHTYCEEERLNVKPLKWTMTLALLTDVEPCPLPGVTNHSVTRQCLYNESTPQRGQWARPNVTDCIHSAVQKLKESLSNQTSFDEKSTTHVMSVLNTFIDLVNSSSVESSVDHDVIIHIGDILNKASNFKPNSTLTEQSSLSLATKFAKAIDYITDIKSLDKLTNANTKEIGVIMDVVLDSARTFFKTLSESMVVPRASSSNQPTLKVKQKNVDFRLTLWDNKRTLVDESMSTIVGLPPLKSFYPRDIGKALWLYIARLNNVAKLIGISENKTLKEIEAPSDIMSDVLSVEFFNKSTFSMNEPVILHFALKNVTRLSYGRLICMSFESNKEDG
ncbi:adhesion G-protein coupled receptor D1, partial [Biomphalaria pfeifferi]